jgi:hypothetical protein
LFQPACTHVDATPSSLRRVTEPLQRDAPPGAIRYLPDESALAGGYDQGVALVCGGLRAHFASPGGI